MRDKQRWALTSSPPSCHHLIFSKFNRHSANLTNSNLWLCLSMEGHLASHLSSQHLVDSLFQLLLTSRWRLAESVVLVTNHRGPRKGALCQAVEKQRWPKLETAKEAKDTSKKLSLPVSLNEEPIPCPCPRYPSRSSPKSNTNRKASLTSP